MSLAMIDAREWQNSFDLATGAHAPIDGPVAHMVGKILGAHPYPGDLEDAANQWVTDTALDLMKAYRPGLVCLSYAQQFFDLRHFPHSPDTRERLLAGAMAEAQRFIRLSNCIPVIVGTGPLVPLETELDLSGLDGLAISSNWSARYCGVHYPSSRDMEQLKTLHGIERIVPKQEWLDLFIAAQPELDLPDEFALLPDYLLAAKPGVSFKALGTTLRRPVTAPAPAFQVPVSTPLGKADDLRDLKELILSALSLSGPPIALIILEGLDAAHFPQDHFMVKNGADWFCNEPGDAFYLTLTTGKHQPFAYPQGLRFFDQDEADPQFPFSGYFREIPQQTLGLHTPFKSIACGNRSMFMHMVFGADISVECFARNLFNQGCLAVIHDTSKWKEPA